MALDNLSAPVVEGDATLGGNPYVELAVTVVDNTVPVTVETGLSSECWTLSTTDKYTL